MAKARDIVGLDCGAGAREGMRLVLLTRLEEVCGFRASALDFDDPAGVHDMRVASRRLRSALRDFRPYLRGGERLDAGRAELKALADVLGGVRDDDVAIHALERLREDAPKKLSGGITAFVDDRRGRRDAARRELERALGGESLEAMRARLTGAFEEATETRGAGGLAGGDGDAESSFREAGRDIILARWRELEALSPSLYRPFKVKRLHKMRIAAKRLRYALELFAACGGDAFGEVAERVAELQGALGDLHDSDGWIEGFGDYLSGVDESRRRRGVDSEKHVPEQERAAFHLLEHFAKERSKRYRASLALWCEWGADDFAGRLASLVNAALSSDAPARHAAEAEPSV